MTTKVQRRSYKSKSSKSRNRSHSNKKTKKSSRSKRNLTNMRGGGGDPYCMSMSNPLFSDDVYGRYKKRGYWFEIMSPEESDNFEIRKKTSPNETFSVTKINFNKDKDIKCLQWKQIL
jgi:hypothetical protein